MGAGALFAGIDRGPGVLGVVGTFVLDRIEGHPDAPDPVEDLGGVAYALSAVSAALPHGWRAMAISRVGADALDRVRAWLAGIPRVADSSLLEVDEPNNRVELRYADAERRTERLSGGVGPWTWDELEARLDACDAVLLNFVSGHELSLSTARRVRDRVSGPLYVDLHSLFLGMGDDGTRVPRPLGRASSWVSCGDAVQVNEHEFELLEGSLIEEFGSGGRPSRPADGSLGADGRVLRSADETAREVLGQGPRLLARTGRRGVACWTRRAPGGRVERVDVAVAVKRGDPTGCGDVWGGTMFSRLLGGDDIVVAARLANRAAGVSVTHRGTSGLSSRLAMEVGGSAPDGGTS